MSKAETIARLESLLSRVRSRAAEPRPSRTSTVNGGPLAAAAPRPAPAPATAVDEVEEVELVTIPPPAQAPALPTALARPIHMPSPTPPAPPVQLVEAETTVYEVDVPPEVALEAVIAVTAEEPKAVESLDSRERLVAAEPVVGIAVEAVALETAEESPPEILASVEEVEEAPLSSRRPVAPEPEERLADIAFGVEEPRPPRHTPPPESGRLPAVPAREFDGDVTGVHEAPLVARTHELVAESTQAQLAPTDAVADLVGEAQRFAPPTFVALLDASLAL